MLSKAKPEANRGRAMCFRFESNLLHFFSVDSFPLEIFDIDLYEPARFEAFAGYFVQEKEGERRLS